MVSPWVNKCIAGKEVVERDAAVWCGRWSSSGSLVCHPLGGWRIGCTHPAMSLRLLWASKWWEFHHWTRLRIPCKDGRAFPPTPRKRFQLYVLPLWLFCLNCRCYYCCNINGGGRGGGRWKIGATASRVSQWSPRDDLGWWEGSYYPWSFDGSQLCPWGGKDSHLSYDRWQEGSQHGSWGYDCNCHGGMGWGGNRWCRWSVSRNG